MPHVHRLAKKSLNEELAVELPDCTAADVRSAFAMCARAATAAASNRVGVVFSEGVVRVVDSTPLALIPPLALTPPSTRSTPPHMLPLHTALELPIMPLLTASANMEPTIEKVMALDRVYHSPSWAGEQVLALVNETTIGLAAPDTRGQHSAAGPSRSPLAPPPRFSEALRRKAQATGSLQHSAGRRPSPMEGIGQGGGAGLFLRDPDADASTVCKPM